MPLTAEAWSDFPLKTDGVASSSEHRAPNLCVQIPTAPGRPPRLRGSRCAPRYSSRLAPLVFAVLRSMLLHDLS